MNPEKKVAQLLGEREISTPATLPHSAELKSGCRLNSSEVSPPAPTAKFKRCLSIGSWPAGSVLIGAFCDGASAKEIDVKIPNANNDERKVMAVFISHFCGTES
jgi:hypothetical protein